MIKENLGQFEDGSVMKHPATVVGTISTGIVLQDDADIFYLLPTDNPAMFDIGTTMSADNLLPVIGLQKELANLMKGV